MKTKPTLAAVPEQPSSDNPLVDRGSVNESLDRMEAYAAFLCEHFARDSTGDPGERLQHGQYLAMCVLLDALAVVGQEKGGTS